jgi:hypothetical protein
VKSGEREVVFKGKSMQCLADKTGMLGLGVQLSDKSTVHSMWEALCSIPSTAKRRGEERRRRRKK